VAGRAAVDFAEGVAEAAVVAEAPFLGDFGEGQCVGADVAGGGGQSHAQRELTVAGAHAAAEHRCETAWA